MECDNPEIKLSVWRYQDKLAVFLRNYEPETLRARLKLPQFYSKLTDTLSRRAFLRQTISSWSFKRPCKGVFGRVNGASAHDVKAPALLQGAIDANPVFVFPAQLVEQY